MSRETGSSSPIRIGIVDDHPVFRYGLHRLLDREADITVEWEHPNSIGLEALLQAHPVDVVLMDLEFGSSVNGLQATREATARWPKVRVIVLSGSLDPDSPQAALAAGAVGFLSKDRAPSELLESIRRLVTGLPERRSGRVGSPLALSRREQQVLLEIRRGKTNREIAASLGVSITTVNKHVQKVLHKLKVRNRTQAAAGGMDASA